jgi:hypothetical protein
VAEGEVVAPAKGRSDEASDSRALSLAYT